MKTIRSKDGRIFTIRDDNTVTEFGRGPIGKVDGSRIVIDGEIYRVQGNDIISGANKGVASLYGNELVINNEPTDKSSGYVGSGGDFDIGDAVRFSKKHIIKPINILTVLFLAFLAAICILNSKGIDIFDFVNNQILPKVDELKLYLSNFEDIVALIEIVGSIVIPIGVVIWAFVGSKKK